MKNDGTVRLQARIGGETHSGMHLNIDHSHLQLRRRWAPSSLYRLVAACLAVVMWAYVTPGVAATPKPATVTEEDNGKTVEVSLDQTLIVRLASNPTTGYQWRVVGSSPAPLEFVASDYASDPQAAGRVGAGGTQTLRFTAKSAGKAELKLGYARPWEKDVPPAKTFSLTVVVK